MLRSMTGYGRAILDTKLGHFSVEIQSVNRKYLESNISLPIELQRFEGEVKKWISNAISRGQVHVKFHVIYDSDAPLTVTPNIPLAKQLKAAWDQIAEELQVIYPKSKTPFTLDLIKNTEGLLCINEDLINEESFKEALHSVFHLALNDFIEMKTNEGKELQKDISKRLNNLKQSIALIAQKAPEVPKKYHQKLLERIEQIIPNNAELDDRILKEIALYAEKSDITEEIVRFNSHLNKIEKLLEGKESSVGKTFEFILQELNREINTIGSKGSDITISHSVVDCKSELERIREQIQNVE